MRTWSSPSRRQSSAPSAVDPELVAKTLHACSGASYALELVAAMGSAEALLEGAGRFVHKDVMTARSAADDVGARLGVLGVASDAALVRTRPD